MSKFIFSLLIGILNCLSTIKHNNQIEILLLSMIFSFFMPVIVYNMILDFVETHRVEEYYKGIFMTIITILLMGLFLFVDIGQVMSELTILAIKTIWRIL